ncbi:MAG: hypothetical protein SFY70_08050 [Bacteroidia bacterium]|nr:hypothetical protein [Bacteroidia bacterium]
MRYFILLLLAFGLFKLGAQTPEAPTLVVAPAAPASKLTPRERLALRPLRTGLQRTAEETVQLLGVYQLLDRSRTAALMDEQKFQDVLSDQAVAELGKAAGAQYILFPVIEAGDNALGRASALVNVKIIEVETTKIVFVKALTPSADVGRFRNEVEAMNQLLTDFKAQLARELFVHHKLHERTYPVAEVIRDGKGVPTGAVVFAKNPFFAHPGTVLSLVTLNEVTYEGQTETSTREVGLLTVTAVRGDNLDCELQGKKADRAAVGTLLQQGTTLYAVLRP